MLWMGQRDRPEWFRSPGATKLHRLEENIGAVSLELTPDDLRNIEEAVAQIPVQGARYPESAQRMIER